MRKIQPISHAIDGRRLKPTISSILSSPRHSVIIEPADVIGPKTGKSLTHSLTHETRRRGRHQDGESETAAHGGGGEGPETAHEATAGVLVGRRRAARLPGSMFIAGNRFPAWLTTWDLSWAELLTLSASARRFQTTCHPAMKTASPKLSKLWRSRERVWRGFRRALSRPKSKKAGWLKRETQAGRRAWISACTAFIAKIAG